MGNDITECVANTYERRLWKPLVLTQSRESSPHYSTNPALTLESTCVCRSDRRRAVVVDESLGGDNFLFICRRRPLLTDGAGDVAAFPCFQGGDGAKKLSERELIGTPKFDKVLNDLR